MIQYLSGLPAFLLWLGLSIVLTVAFVLLYLWITPQRELELVRHGNVSASICLSGAALGFVLPLASAMVHGTNLLDFALWGLIAMAVQLCAYLALRLTFRGMTRDIIEDRVSVALLVAAASVLTGILNAAAMFE